MEERESNEALYIKPLNVGVKKIQLKTNKNNTTFFIKESISLIEIVHLEIYRVAFVLGEI